MSLLMNPVDRHWDQRLFSTPWPLVGVVGAYLYFVLKAGPRLMANRPPFSLRYLIAAYNLFLVVAFIWGFIRMNRVTHGQFFMLHCRRNSIRPEIYNEILDINYLYFLSKLVELLDTVFFVLRKKTNQISFLHVYHHTNMALMTWGFLRYMPGSQLMIIAYSNTFVHILMYSYYFLSAFGPAIQKYLWWKKYLTRIQIIQFLVIMSFFAVLLVSPGCQVSKEGIVLAICNTSSFLVLFLFFYAKAYSKKTSKVQ